MSNFREEEDLFEEDIVFDQARLLNHSSKFNSAIRRVSSGKCGLFSKTIGLCGAFFGLGLCIAIPGPTFLSPMLTLQTEMSPISSIYAARSAGYLIGAVIGGFLFDHFNRLFLLFISLLLTSLLIMIVPWCEVFWLLQACMVVLGISMGFLDTGGNVLCLDLWGRNSGPFMQALHFSFGLGAFIAPLLAVPFLEIPFLTNLSSNSVNVYSEAPSNLHGLHSSGFGVIPRVKRDLQPYVNTSQLLLPVDNSPSIALIFSNMSVSMENESMITTSSRSVTETKHTLSLEELFLPTTVIKPTVSTQRVPKPKPSKTDGSKLGPENWDKVHVGKPPIADLIPPSTMIPTSVDHPSTLSFYSSYVTQISIVSNKTKDDFEISRKVETNNNTDAYVESTSKTHTNGTEINLGSSISKISGEKSDIPVSITQNDNSSILALNISEDKSARPSFTSNATQDETTTVSNDLKINSGVPASIILEGKSASPILNITEDKSTNHLSNISADKSASLASNISENKSASPKQNISEYKSSPVPNISENKSASPVSNTFEDETAIPASNTTVQTLSTIDTVIETIHHISTAKNVQLSTSPTLLHVNTSTRDGVESEMTLDYPATVLDSIMFSENDDRHESHDYEMNDFKQDSVNAHSSRVESTTVGAESNTTLTYLETLTVGQSETMLTPSSDSTVHTHRFKPGTFDNDTEDINTIFNIFANKIEKYGLSKIQFTYLIVGLFLFLISLVFLGFLCHNPRDPKSKQEEGHGANKVTNQTKSNVLVLLMAIFLLLYVGVEVAYGQMIIAFAMRSDLRLPQSTGILLSAVFWGSFAAMRFASIFISSGLSPMSMLMLNIGLCTLGTVILAAVGNSIETGLWIGTVLIGVGFASIFPTSILWIERYIHISNKVAAVFVIGVTLGEMICPIMVYHLMVRHPTLLLYFTLVINILCVLIFTTLWWVASRLGEKYCVVNNNGYQLANQNDEEGDMIEMSPSTSRLSLRRQSMASEHRSLLNGNLTRRP